MNPIHKKVLIIEDDSLTQKAYQLKLSKEGVEVISVSDGQEALDLLKKDLPEKPGAVILDLMLPLVSGFEVLETMRKTKGWENMPVIVLSNLSQPSDIEKAKNLGVKDYLVKADVRIDEVVKKVMSYL